MSKVYKCDCCGVTIENAHSANMREFYIGYDYDVAGGIFPVQLQLKRTTKIHLCEDCYRGLKEIGGRVKSGEKNNGRCTQINCPNNKDCMCHYPLFGECIISNCRKGEGE